MDKASENFTQIKTKLLNQDMDRREFLAYAAGALLIISGASSISKALKYKSQQQSQGFGTGSYGGKK